VVRELGGRARFKVENYGDSELARRSGVTRYPALFVDDVLVVTPKDLGFFGKGEGTDGGRYAPLKSAASHERLRADLRRMIDLVLAGRKEAARALAPTEGGGGPARFPSVTITDLDGRAISAADLAGRPVLVEIWATWCPPCRSTLAWLGELKKKHGARLAIVTLAIESDESAVRKLAKDLDLPLGWAMGTPEVIRSFGDVSSVPTLLLYDRKGKAAGAFYGAPPDLHARVEAALQSMSERPRK
jgi:thiol-disulfide isomerase/thioredoxin